MIENIFCVLVGEHFSPHLFTEKTGLQLALAQESNATTVGCANLVVPEIIDNKIDWLVLQIQTHYETALACGADKELMEISVLIKMDKMLNWSVSPENMAILGKLNIPLCVTIYQKSENEEVLEMEVNA